MGFVISWIGKTLLTEKIMKQLLIALGDYLVSSSKNKLDDALWAKVKKVLKWQESKHKYLGVLKEE